MGKPHDDEADRFALRCGDVDQVCLSSCYIFYTSMLDYVGFTGGDHK